MATIREISEKSNVSIATVSKVLNGKGTISAETKNRVLSVARSLNYVPNLNARNLKSGHSRTIGIITEDLTVFNTPEIVDGIAETCDSENYHYILGNLRLFKLYGNGIRDIKKINQSVQAEIDDMLSKQVDGIIYVGCHSHIVAPLSSKTDAKFVCAYCISNNPNIPSIVYNEEKAAYDLTHRLIEYGCKKIGMITGPDDSSHSRNRTLGFQKALYDYGIPFNPDFRVSGDWERDSGYSLTKKLLDFGVDAIFSHNDIMAMGVLDYCNQQNIVVGRDLKLIGFDNCDISSVCRPKLSTVALPLFEIGQTAAKEMFKILNGVKPSESLISLNCSIIERESTLGTI